MSEKIDIDKLFKKAATLSKTAGDKTAEELSGKDVDLSTFMQAYLGNVLAVVEDEMLKARNS